MPYTNPAKIAFVASMLASLICAVAIADEPAPPAASQASPPPAEEPQVKDGTTLELGTVKVTGQRDVIVTLQAIKSALKQPYSDDPAHAQDMVCRIEKQLGEAREYLDCATNAVYGHRRDATQTAWFLGGWGQADHANLFKGLVAKQPEHRLRVPVNGGGLQALLQQIPDAPEPTPGAGTQAAPAAATVPRS